jgi:hypothetical protein
MKMFFHINNIILANKYIYQFGKLSKNQPVCHAVKGLETSVAETRYMKDICAERTNFVEMPAKPG